MANAGRFISSFAGRTEQAALVHASAAAGLTFQRNLLPRTTRDQAIVTGATVALNYGWCIALQSLTEGVAHRVAGSGSGTADVAARRVVSLLGDAAAIGVGLGIRQAFSQHPNERVPRAAVRTFGRGLATSGIAGVLVGAAEIALNSRSSSSSPNRFPVALPIGAAIAGTAFYAVKRREQKSRQDAGEQVVEESASVSVGKAAGMALGVSASLAVVAVAERGVANVVALGADVLLGESSWSRPFGHLAALGGLVGAGVFAYDRAVSAQEQGSDAIEAAYNSAPAGNNVSGGPASSIPWDTLSREGRRFVGMALSAEDITHVMDEPAMEPLRLYSGLGSAPDPGTRVDVLLDEMDRMGAYERSTICVFAPTGSGYVNYVGAEALEYMTRGDVASVVLQYSKRPSFMSLDKVGVGRFQVRDLMRAVSTRIAAMPEGSRPRLLLFGESLGAHVSQDAFLHQGVRGLESFGIESALWLGTPHASEWKHQIYDSGEEIPESLIEVASPDELHALPEDERKKARFVLLTHHEDPIPKFSPRLMVQKPAWLGPPMEREPGIGREVLWLPIATFMATGVDLLNAMNMQPGNFRAFAHDYRSDIREFVEFTYRLDADDEQRERMDQALRERESRWARQRLIADEMQKANEAIRDKLEKLADAVSA